MSKYNNTKTVIDGIKFDSKKESNRYAELKLLERAGVISDLELQPEYILQPAFTSFCGGVIRAIKYRGDFRFIENGKVVVVDVKGYTKIKEYIIKKKLLLYTYPNIIFREE